MSNYLPPVSPLSSSMMSSLLSLLPDSLGDSSALDGSGSPDTGDPLDFSQILDSQMLGQSGAGALGLSDTAGLLGTSNGNDMMEELMALSLVLLVDKLVDPAASGTNSAGSAAAAAAVPDEDEASDPAAPTSTADEPNTKWPTAGPISQDFHPGHTGTDIAVPTGTPIDSTQAGKVVSAGWNDQGYGNLVIVENGAYRTYYAHLSQINVKVGDSVAQGSQVGLSGSTGNSTGPHVHYEVRFNNVPVAPENLP